MENLLSLVADGAARGESEAKRLFISSTRTKYISIHVVSRGVEEGAEVTVFDWLVANLAPVLRWLGTGTNT